MIRIGPLGDEQRRAVGRVAQRAHMVRLSSRGYTVAQIAAIFEVGEDAARGWLRRSERAGADGLDDRPRPGRPPRDRLARHSVDAQMHNSPRANGLVQGCWTVGLLAAFLAARFRLALAPCTVRRPLRASGGRWARPRLDGATRAPRAQRKEDPAAPFKLRLLERALASAAPVLDLDERELQRLPVVRAMGMKGPRARAPTPGQNAKRAVFGARDARTGALHHLVRERKRAAGFVASLEHLAVAYPAGRHAEVVLARDNVATHDARLVRARLARPEHARSRLLRLPKYAAHEHNPIARCWGLMQDAGAANRLHGSLDELVAHAGRYLAEARFTAPHPQPAAAPAPLAHAA